MRSGVLSSRYRSRLVSSWRARRNRTDGRRGEGGSIIAVSAGAAAGKGQTSRDHQSQSSVH